MADDKPLILSNCYYDNLVFKDTITGLFNNYNHMKMMEEQKKIELNITKTVGDYFSKMMVKNSYITHAENFKFVS